MQPPENFAMSSGDATSMSHHPCWDEFRWCSCPWDTYASVRNPKKPTGSPSWTWVELFLIYHPCPIWHEQTSVHISPGKATDGNPRHLSVSLGKVSSKPDSHSVFFPPTHTAWNNHHSSDHSFKKLTYVNDSEICLALTQINSTATGEIWMHYLDLCCVI